ncbi:MAG: hypothetical protein OXN84_04895, partial [Albidovulum sp.]|nr:hypothetical protein [Albidovulum sp.]
ELKTSVAATELTLAQALASLQASENQSVARLEEILLIEQRLNDSERRRLAEEAAAAILLEEAEKERDEFRNAHTGALAQISALETRLSEEQASRLD